MDQPHVVIVSSRSLFVEGVATRLRQHLGEREIHVVDASAADALTQVAARGPSTVILDATDAEVDQHCSLGSLLSALPSLTVIRLDPQQEQIQIVTSQRRMVGQVSDLIKVIQPDASSSVGQ